MTEPRATPSPSELKERRRQAIIGSVVFTVLAVVLVGMLATSYVRNAPLRGTGLTSAQATVTDYDYNRRRSDEIAVTYDVPGQGPVAADIPVSERFDDGDVVEVRYAPDEPTLVRTVEHWSPAYTSPFTIIVAVFTVLLLIFTLVGVARPSMMPATAQRSGSAAAAFRGSRLRLVLLGVALLVGFLAATLR